MTATHSALLVLTVVCAALAAAVARLTVRMREITARSDAELARLRGELSGLDERRNTLERLVTTDPVTGVGNHRRFQDALGDELARARRADRPLALLMCDVDRFRDVNAAHGHQTGSSVLRELAQRLALEIRSFDTFARYGGEEFVVLLPDTGAEGAAAVAERLCYVARKLAVTAHIDGTVPVGAVPVGTVPASAVSVGTVPVSAAASASGGRGGAGAAGTGAVGTVQTGAAQSGVAAGTLHLTISIGGAVFPHSGEHAATLLRAADAALAEAKRAGGDTWSVPTMSNAGPDSTGLRRTGIGRTGSG
ncbi:MAG TPA: GGDEF domain-containing protein [Actinocrinis sp.]